MFMISLKAYNQEIEQLIDHGQYDEAIAHCVHILITYPKCIDSYRNLGKSLLELKKYPEALDVFSRVLSAIPDDFISHVGLSIIFEDQTNLDLAIWHMEQAFDVQPSNLTIQDELKRLFGRRDGEHPTKIRLTRGALVRMYARGELFQQAISEIRSILEEDPRRIDLEMILARMFYFSGEMDESTAKCNQIIEKIPYCFEVNQILQQILINKNDIAGADLCKNRLISLDPYYQYQPNPFSDQEIPENKVLLEKLQYIPSKDSSTQIPSWLEHIDVPNEKKLDESFDWLGDLHNNDAATTNSVLNPFTTTEQNNNVHLTNEAIPSDDILPEWMQKERWNSNLDSESPDEIQSSNSQRFEPQELTSVAQSYDQPKEIKAQIISNVSNEDIASLFTELKEGKMENDGLSLNTNDEKQFPPSDWMSQFSNSDGPTSSESSDQDFPDWLKNFQAEEPQITPNSDDMPDWLKNLQSEIEPIAQASDDSQNDIAAVINDGEETIFDPIFTETEKVNDSPVYEESQQPSSEKDDGWESVDLTKEILDESVESIGDPMESVDEQLEPVDESNEPVYEQIEPEIKSVEPVDELEPVIESIEPVDEQEFISESKEHVEESIQIDNRPGESSYVSSDDKIPDWVKSVLLDQNSNDQKTQTQDQESFQEMAANPPSLEVNAQEVNSDEIIESAVESDAGIISQQTNDELLDWLRGLKTEEESLQQIDETENSFQTPTEVFIEPEPEIVTKSEIETEPELGTEPEIAIEPEIAAEEETLADILFPKEDVDLNVLDREQSNLLEDNLGTVLTPSEFDSEPVIGQEQSINSGSDNIEFYDEQTEPLSMVEPGEKIQTSELHLDSLLANPEENSIEELLIQGDFDNLSAAVSFSVAQGQDFHQILSTITAAENNYENNFSYWQCLGDIYSRINHLNDALMAYQKAEDILIKTISS